MRIARSVRGRCLSLSLGIAVVGAASVGCGGGGGSPGSGNASIVHLKTTTVAGGVTGVPYAQTFEAEIPHPPGIFVVTGGSLPPGLALNKQTGELTGYPRQTGAFHFQIGARDGADPTIPLNRDANFSEDRGSFVLNVALGAPNILPQVLPGAQYRASYGYQIDVAGGTPPYTFAMTGGSLPTGLTVSPTGFVGSFPTQTQVAPYQFQVTVTDSQNLSDTDTLSVSVFVLPLVILTNSQLPEAAINFPYDRPLDLASGGGGPPYTWSQATPTGTEVNLSAIGLQLTPTGHIMDMGSGVTSLGTFTFTIQVTDEALQLASRQFTLKVNPGPVLSTISPNRSSSAGPFTVTGLNFQPGVQLIFKPGAGQSLIAPTVVNSTTLTFNSPVPVPGSGAGAVDVMVKNPDGGTYTKPTAFIFPAANLSFGSKGFVADALSSTGLDAADVNGDGKADLVHCGAAGYQSTPSGTLSSASGGGLNYLRNLGTNPPTFVSTNLSTGSFTDVKFADVNSDGRLDIIGLGKASIQVWLNGTGGNPLGTFSASPITSALYNGGTTIYWPTDLAVGKFDANSIPDIVYGAVYYNSGGYNAGRCFTMKGDGSGGFTPLDAAISTIQASTQANYCMGIHTVGCVDLDNDGRSEVVAGTGMGYYNGTYPLLYNALSSTGTFGSWVQKGTTIAAPQYPGIQGLAVGDFLGNGSRQVVVGATGATNYSNLSNLFMLSGSGLTTQTAITAPSSGKTKCICAADLDFDPKQEWVVTTNPSSIAIYRGSTQAVAVTLDASSGSPSIASPKTGKVACGDLDGDGKPDVIATCSYWAGEGMASWQNGTNYQLGMNGDGGQMGLVFFLNTSN